MFDSSEVLSVQFRVFAEKEPDQVQLQRLEDLLSKLGNLEELRLEVHQRSNTIPSPEKQMGVGQLYAEYLPLTRRRCNLKITIRDGGSVDWKHLFDEETDELDKTDYRNLGTQTATTQPARTMWSSNSSISLSPILLPSQSAPLVPSPPVSSIHSPSSSPDHSSAPNPIHLSMYTSPILPPFPSLYPISDSPPELLPNPAFPTFNSSTIWPHIQPPQPPHPRLIDKNGNTHGPMEYDETAVGLCGILDV